MKKFGQFYLNLFKKFGVLIPLVIVALIFVAGLFMDQNNLFSSILESTNAGFIVLAIVGILAVLVCAVLVVVKVKASDVTVVDLCLEMFSALALVMLIMFCFNPGQSGSPVTVLKWLLTSVGLVASLVISYVRAQSIE